MSRGKRHVFNNKRTGNGLPDIHPINQTGNLTFEISDKQLYKHQANFKLKRNSYGCDLTIENFILDEHESSCNFTLSESQIKRLMSMLEFPALFASIDGFEENALGFSKNERVSITVYAKDDKNFQMNFSNFGLEGNQVGPTFDFPLFKDQLSRALYEVTK